MSYIYETEEGDTFAMCPVCVLTTQDVEGEYHCHGCQQWYLLRHTDGEFVVEPIYDRIGDEEVPHATQPSHRNGH